MHRTEGPDYITESGKRRYKETPSPATVVNKFHMNAIQEEICLAIENVGLTLAASGSADRTAGWGQLYLAILRTILVDVRSFGAKADGSADATSAFNSALAYSGAIYIPQGTFRLDGALTIPANAAIVGSGKMSQLLFNTTATKIGISTQNVLIKDLLIKDGGSSPDQNGIDINFTTNPEATVILENVFIQDMKGNLSIQSNVAHRGYVFGNNITLESPKSSGWNLLCNNIGGGAYACKCIGFINLKCIQSNNSDINIDLRGDATNGGGPILINNSHIIGGHFYWRNDTARTWVKNSILDLDTYHFRGNPGGGFEGCTILGDENNTILNNDNSENSRIFWLRNRSPDGKRYPLKIHYDGIYVRRERATSEQSIAVGTDTIDFNSEILRAMTNNDSYLKDQPWNATDKRFELQGYGERWVHVNCVVIVGNLDTSSWSSANDVDVFLDVNDGAASGKQLPFDRHVLVEHASNGDMVFSFKGSVRVFGSGGTWRGVRVRITNGQADACVISYATVGGYDTHIEIEGL